VVARKPEFYGAQQASTFQLPSVVAAYHARPPYPPAVFDQLLRLLPPGERIVLDLGCGTGVFARRLAEHVDRVDALDIAPLMIEEARRQPGGDQPNIRWVAGSAETAPLDVSYGLIVAGASIHWMDWGVVFPRMRALLAPGAMLAIVDDQQVAPWDPALRSLIVRYSTNSTFRPEYDMIADLAGQGLFRLHGSMRSDPEPVEQDLEDYVLSFHARQSLARERLGQERSTEFDRELRELLREQVSPRGTVAFQTIGHMWWGR
jgi:SAM-dependent methyltransferase